MLLWSLPLWKGGRCREVEIRVNVSDVWPVRLNTFGNDYFVVGSRHTLLKTFLSSYSMRTGTPIERENRHFYAVVVQ